MAFPHTKPRKGHYGNNDKPNTDGVLWNFFNRTINIAKYRNAKTMWIQGTIERLVASFMIDFSPIYRRPGIILLVFELCRRISVYPRQDLLWGREAVMTLSRP
jgi:hypothetical protein